MGQYYLAVDIGASSGRHILGWMEDGKIRLEEIHRFENEMIQQGEHLYWDTGYLFREIVLGMKKCREAGRIPVSMSVDTWSVDYVLLDENDEILGGAFAYRDARTEGMDREVYRLIPEKEMYERTGIQKLSFNSIYQLMAVKQQTPELLRKARALLMLPDYFHFLLTGNKMSDYTTATTTQLVSPVTMQWDKELIRRLGYPEEMFLPLQMPGVEVGELRKEIQEEVGFNCKVALCATHDTASAVMAIPTTEKNAPYISSGTWSLMGLEIPHAICDEASRKGNFSNEGGYEYRFRYLKNIMGLWMIQSVRREQGKKYSYAQLCEMAEQCREFPSRVDVNSDCFLAPKSMTETIRRSCEQSGQPVPETPGELATVIYASLADCYAETVRELERNVGCEISSIHIIGGGSNAAYLNQLTANASGKTVWSGPAEATSIGNILAQMIKNGELENLNAARECVKRSFDIQKFTPVIKLGN